MENNTQLTATWNMAEKITFRFAFLFFLLFILTKNNGAYPFLDKVMYYPDTLLEKMIPWIGMHILHLPYEITTFTNGSADTTYDYVLLFTVFMLSVLGGVIWSLLDKKREQYNILYYWLTAAIRFYVGLMLIHYGLSKVIQLQFSPPDLYKLSQNLGDSSPMGLAWAFLGFSYGYNLFMGISELAAVLLLFRRTMTLGAIITLMATLNVMVVNYCYDVPVKILSTALVIMTMFLLLKDAGRLYRFFIKGEEVQLPVIKAPVFKKRGLRIAKRVLKILLVGNALILGAIGVWNLKEYYAEQEKPKLYGLYSVDLFVLSKDTLPPVLTDSVRWNQVVIEEEGFTRVRYMGDSVLGLLTELDTTKQIMDFSIRRDTSFKCSFHYELTDSNRFYLVGNIGRDSVHMIITRRLSDTKNFRLMKRGFHWINERPYYR